MKIIKTKIKDLLILKTNIYEDKRGFFKEVFREKILNNFEETIHNIINNKE